MDAMHPQEPQSGLPPYWHGVILVFKSADSKSIRFDFDKNCGIDVSKEAHMHALTLTFDDSDTITASCKAIMDGKEMPEKPTTLKRVKS